MHALVKLWWERLPTLGKRCSKGLGMALGEGVYLTAWPRFAALAPAGALLLGVIAGWRRFGGEQVFTQSYIIISVAIGLGLVASQLGALFTVGYALGDFLLWRHPGFPANDLLARVQLLGGLLVVYAALAMLATGIPLTVRALRAQTPLPSERAADAHVLLDTLVGGALAASLTYLYIQALPMLIRPLFIWQGMTPSVDSVAPAQRQAWVFVLIAAVVGAARVLVEYGACLIDPGAIAHRAAALDAASSSLWGQSPAGLRIAIAAIASTCLLGGLLLSWIDAVLLFSGLLVVSAIRMLLPAHIPAWPQTMGRIPAIVRLPAALGLSYLVSLGIVSERLSGQSFMPLIWGLLAALLCVALVFPDQPDSGSMATEVPAAEEQT